MADEEKASGAEIRKRYRFLLSSFTQEERQELANSIFKLGGSYSESSHYTMSCTHIVSKKPNRGEKFLCGAAAGKWILRREYIDSSVKAQRWLNEEDYEWNNQCSYDGIPKGHVSAPYRWRKELSLSHTGPFDTWKALVILKDTKKSTAYKSLLDIGQATVLTAKVPYNNSLIRKATHVFVEKALEDDVQCFADAGIPCLSPDYIPEYILQDPKPSMQDYYISKMSVSTMVSTMKRGISSRQVTPLFPVGEGNIPKTQSRLTDSKPEKRQMKSVLDENQLPPAKKSKQIKHAADVFPKWLECYSGNPLLNGMDLAFSRKVSKDVSIFPHHVVEAIENYLEEDEPIAVSVIKSFLSSTRYPSPVLVSTIMNRLLLKTSSPKLANASCSLLQLLLVLHPPSVRSTLYYQAMCSPTLTSDKEVKLNGSAWEYLSMVFWQSLGVPDRNIENNPSVNTKQDQTRNSSLMLMKFLCSVFENNFCGLMGSKDMKIEDATKCRETLTWKVFWPDGILAVNCAVRELLKLTWISASQSQQDSSLFPVLHYLQGLVSMVAACFELTDQSIMGDRHSFGIGAGSWMMSLATEMVLTCGRSHKQEDGLRVLLQSLQPTWLKVQILDIMLSSYNDCLVPAQCKSLLAGELSLEKIVSCYFYLLPVVNTSNQDDVIEHVEIPETKNDSTRSSVLTLITDANRYHGSVEQLNRTPEKTRKNPLNKRNKKGETPLHIAAIKNDPAKVKELINAGADVNLTDNAGWTPLHEACNHGNIKCVEEILRVRPLLYKPTQKGLTGLDIMTSPLCGTTPLHDAVANNHIDVAKALVSAGGLLLLQAKTSDGKTPADISRCKEMITFLKTAEKNLTDLSTEHSLSNEQTRTQKNNSDNVYHKMLGPRGSRTAKHITPEKCQEYVLLLSQLLQGFTRLQGESIGDKETKEAVMIDHVNGLERHLHAITIDSKLTVICKTRLENMKLL